MKVGVLCEESATVREAFRRRGHDAVSCDMQDTRIPGPHRKGDCRDFDWSGFDILICHPPCTYLCNSGVRWLWLEDGSKNEPRWAAMREAAGLFKWMLGLRANVGVAIENPIMHKYALELIGVRHNQVVQPWMFGDGECKATCLWLIGLPPLVVDEAPLYVQSRVVSGRGQSVHRCPPGSDRARIRSTTFPGIAEAMAVQWGGLGGKHEQ